MRGLEGKGVLISGGSSGIGAAAALRFLEEGSRVVIAGLDAQQVDTVVGDLAARGEISGLACDVARIEEAERLVQAADETLRGVDVLLNNAGIAWKEPFLDIDAANWDRIIDVNLRGMFLVAQGVARRMAERGHGVIVNMASTNALGGEADFAHYNASKGGVLQLTRTMAVELGPKGIRVNCLCPGFIDTPLNEGLASADEAAVYARDRIPLGRAGSADEVAAAYAFLASDESSFVHGEALVIDGGQTAMM
jgi:NAD(P)-dependent dehydrogenase (short-subunit alcohol dehydrogenase family)